MWRMDSREMESAGDGMENAEKNKGRKPNKVIKME